MDAYLSLQTTYAKCCQSCHEEPEQTHVCGGAWEPVLVKQQVKDVGTWWQASSRCVFIAICLHLSDSLLMFGYQRKCKDSFGKKTAKSGSRSAPGMPAGRISLTWGPLLPASGRYLLASGHPPCPGLPSPGPRLPAWHWGHSLGLPCPPRMVSARAAVPPVRSPAAWLGS